MSEIKAPIDALSKFLRDSYTEEEVKKVYTEWPRSNVKVDLPSISVTTAGNGRFMPEMTTVAESNINDQGQSILLLGEYDLDLQVDFWGSYKKQRETFYNKFMQLFAGQLNTIGTQGLSLPLQNYPVRGFNRFVARFDFNDYNYLDGPNMAAKSEWRISLSLTAHYDRLQVVESSYITNIGLRTEIN